MEGDFVCRVRFIRQHRISIHSLRMEGDFLRHCRSGGGCADFNPLPPHGGRLVDAAYQTYVVTFQSTPSAWRETTHVWDTVVVSAFQSTPSAWRETQKRWEHCRIYDISIHSLRMEGDRCCFYVAALALNFNPLPPHGGRPSSTHFSGRRKKISIHSLRMEGDAEKSGVSYSAYHFNPLPPHGGRPSSTHFSGRRKKFQSTPSAWRETVPVDSAGNLKIISIHSLRMEGDPWMLSRKSRKKYFNPLPPHGGRRL